MAPKKNLPPTDDNHNENQSPGESNNEGLGDTHEPEALTDESDLDLAEPEAKVQSTSPPSPPPGPQSPPHGINLEELALSDDYEAEFVEAGEQTTVIVKKACGIGFFRAHPEKWRNLYMMEIKNGQDRGFYLVGGQALQLLRGLVEQKAANIRLFPARLTLCYGRDVGLFLCPFKLPQPRKANQQDEWSATALRVCKMAETNWVQLFCPAGASCYHWAEAKGLTGEPPWPSLTLEELAAVAFEGKYLTDPEDPVIRRQLGKE
jgi:hypothetical protein